MVLLIKLYNKYENMVIDRMSPIQCTIYIIKHASYIIYIMTQQLCSLSLSLFLLLSLSPHTLSFSRLQPIPEKVSLCKLLSKENRQVGLYADCKDDNG